MKKILFLTRNSLTSEQKRAIFLSHMAALLPGFDTCYFNATDKEVPETLLNLANGNYNQTKNNPLTFVKKKGYKGAGGYLSTGWNALSAGNNHVLGSRSFGVYISEKATTGYLAGTYNANSANSMAMQQQTGFIRVNLNGNISSGTEAAGLYIGVEIGNTFKIYFDGVEVYSDAVNTNINNREFFYHCLNLNGADFGHSDAIIAGGFTARGLTPAEVVTTNKAFKKLIK